MLLHSSVREVDTMRTECENSYFRYKCEKVILSSCGRLRASEARVKSPQEVKITLSLVYRTQFFHTTYAKLDLVHGELLRTFPERILSYLLESPFPRRFRDGAIFYQTDDIA